MNFYKWYQQEQQKSYEHDDPIKIVKIIIATAEISLLNLKNY